MPLPKILICGIGNKLKKDDGLGPCIIQELEKKVLPSNITLSDFGTSAFKTALEIGNYDKVIFVDAIQSGKQPGEICKISLGKEDFIQSASLSSFSVSFHESDLEKILTTATLIKSYPPKAVVIGCEPEDLSHGLGLSNTVEKAISKICDLILDEIG